MTFHRLLTSGAALLFVVLFASLAGSWAIAAPAEPPAGAVLAQATPAKPDTGLSPTKPPLPGGRQSPLRVMVPTDETWRALLAAGITDITQISPNLDPVASFSPGPRMELFPGRPAGAPGLEAAPPTPFRTLAILVEFTDNPAEVSATFFDTLLFGTGPATVRGYYQEVSYGLLDIVTVNLPSSMRWVMAPQSYSYYVNGQSCLGSYPRNCQRLAEDAVALVNPVVDFSRYDNNGDGYVDTVFIIHSGSGAEANGGSPSLIWSHSWWTYSEPLVDGVRVGSYTTEPEYWLAPGDMTHGVYVHELAHAFGLPDLYDVDSSSWGVGDWSLMSSGSWNGQMGNSPAHPDAWSRAYLGFNPVTNITGFNGPITVLNVEQNRYNAIYRLNSGQPGEYWLLENRQKIGSDAALPGSGLLIWHIDDNLTGSNRYECRQVNNYLCAGANKHFRVALEQADSALDLEYNRNQGDTGDPFPGSASKRVFNFTSNPNSTSYYSSADWGVQLRNISVSSGIVTADVGTSVPGTPTPTQVQPTLTPSMTPEPSPTPTALPALQTPPLVAPPDGARLNASAPAFSWGAVSGATSYHLQIDNNPDFSSPEQDATVGNISYTSSQALAEGSTHYWRVRASNATQTSAWSAARSFTIDHTPPPVPRPLSPADNSTTADTTPRFQWSLVSGSSQYRLQVAAEPSFSSPLVDIAQAASSRTYTVPDANALPYGTYYWRAAAQDKWGNWSAWSVTWRLTVNILRAPANAQHITDTTPTFQWSKPIGAVYFELQVDDAPNFSSPAINETLTANKFTPLIPLPYGQYWWRVRVDMGAGWGSWTPVWTVVIAPKAPAAPVLLDPAGGAVLTTASPTLTWQAVPDGGAFRYQLQIDDSSNFNSPLQDVVLPPGQLSYTAAPLPNGGRYYWRVRAVNDFGVAGSWSSRSFTLAQLPRPDLFTPPGAAVSASPAQLFSWASVPDAATYQLEISATRSFSLLVYAVTTTSTSHEVGALPDGKLYWRVRGVTAAGVPGRWSLVRSLTIDTTGPVPPVLLSPANRSSTRNTRPAFSWNAVSDASEYRLQVALDSGFGSAALDGTLTKTAHTPAVPLPFGTYYWRVQARDKLGNWGEWSQPFTFDLTLHKSPANGASTTDTTPTFRWSSLSGAVAYDFQLDDAPDFSTPIGQYTGTGLSYTPPVPLTGGTYYWRVRADVGGGFGAWMPPWSVIVSPETPGKPSLVAPKNNTLTNDNTPMLSWKAATGAITYQVQLDDDSAFGSPQQDVIVGVGLLDYVAATLPDGLYYWRVRGLNSVGGPGGWSVTRSFTVDTTPPVAPALLAPLDGASSTNPRLVLSWGSVSGADRYEVQLDRTSAFVEPPFNTGALTTYTPPMPLVPGEYYWRARAVDRAGNPSAWSVSRRFIIVAGITAPLLPTNTPEMTPTEETTASVEPTVTAETLVTPTETPAALMTFTPTPVLPETLTPQATASVEPTVTAETPVTPTETPAALMTFTPTAVLPETLTPQATATASPTAPPLPTPTLDPLSVWMEAESGVVLPVGAWARVEHPQASGGAYLISSEQGATLTLAFFGPRVDVIYLTESAPARFDLEVDGLIAQTVILPGSASDFAARLTLPLSDGPHTLRLIVREGALAVDAFVVLPQPITPSPTATIEPPTPTPTPTESPTSTPTPTESPTSTPTPTESPTPTPTVTPTDIPPVPTETPVAPPDGNTAEVS